VRLSPGKVPVIPFGWIGEVDGKGRGTCKFVGFGTFRIGAQYADWNMMKLIKR
jgi:hypothetical protein